MFAFFSSIGLDLNELLHVQAHIPQEQRIYGWYCLCEKRNKGHLDGILTLYVKNVYMAILSRQHCRLTICMELVELTNSDQMIRSK